MSIIGPVQRHISYSTSSSNYFSTDSNPTTVTNGRTISQQNYNGKQNAETNLFGSLTDASCAALIAKCCRQLLQPITCDAQLKSSATPSQ